MIYVACRRRQRDFLENNTRVPRKNQKPARTTHSPESLIEFHQSTTDEEKEVPMSTTSTAPSGSSKLRKKLFDLLGDNALYTRLKDDEKRPRSSFKEGKRNRLKKLPTEGNYGVIPQNRLLILDFDDHTENAWSVEKQIDFFSEFLDVDLRKTFAVITQSGGAHIYLLVPEDIRFEDIQSIPKASLRGYNAAFSRIMDRTVELDADIRSAASNAYVVGPTSSIDFVGKKTKYNGYILANESFGFENLNFEILTIPHKGFLRLQEATVVKRQIEQERSSRKKETDDALFDLISAGEKYNKSLVREVYSRTAGIQKSKDEAIPAMPEWADEVSDSSLIHGRPDPIAMSRLKKRIAAQESVKFHQLRAQVKAALHCCYDDYSIALACRLLEIDKDSYRKESIEFSHLISDIKRFKPSVRYHGVYCSKGRQKSVKPRSNALDNYDFNLDEFLEQKKEFLKKKRMSKPSGMVNPQVLDLGKISLALQGNSRKQKASQQYYDAMNIVNHYVQPLSNVGATRVLLAHSDISQSLEISSSRVRQAMRILRERNIIQIAEKQRTGMAASYTVSDAFQHKYLTKSLRLAWGKFNSELGDNRLERSLYFDFSDGNFKTVFGNEKVSPVKDFTNIFDEMMENVKVPFLERQGAGAATRYMKSESEALKSIAEDEEIDEFDERLIEKLLDFEDFDSNSGNSRSVDEETGAVFDLDTGEMMDDLCFTNDSS